MNWYLFIAIFLIIAIVAIFFVTYLLNKKTPVPKGCENLRINEDSCMACNNVMCHVKERFNKIGEEIKDDNKEEK